MKHQAPRPVAASLAAAALLSLLSACSTTSTAPAVEAGGQASEAVAAEKDFYTGSRIAKKTTDRMIRRTDNAGAKEMERDRPPNPGPVFN